MLLFLLIPFCLQLPLRHIIFLHALIWGSSHYTLHLYILSPDSHNSQNPCKMIHTVLYVTNFTYNLSPRDLLFSSTYLQIFLANDYTKHRGVLFQRLLFFSLSIIENYFRSSWKVLACPRSTTGHGIYYCLLPHS